MTWHRETSCIGEGGGQPPVGTEAVRSTFVGSCCVSVGNQKEGLGKGVFRRGPIAF